jgi:hypothetical protein
LQLVAALARRVAEPATCDTGSDRRFHQIDLEGIIGVYSEEQTELGDPAYARDIDLMRADLDAALAGCVAAGAHEVVVCDAHDYSANLSFRELPTGVTLVSGTPAPLSMMTGLDASFDAALFVGYHARAGTAAAVIDYNYAGLVFGCAPGRRRLRARHQRGRRWLSRCAGGVRLRDSEPPRRRSWCRIETA